MATLKQSTAYTRTFLMVDSSDHLSPKTGLTVGVYLSKAGAAFGAVSGSVSEISFGWYKIALNATDTNTLGDLAFHCTGTSADLTDFTDQVTANILGDTLPANVTQWVGVAPNALISGTVDGNIHYPNPIIAVATGTVSANVIQWAGVAPNALISGRVDANAQVVGDKTGYSLSQAFPSNFSSLSIDGSGRIDVGKWVGVIPNALISGTVDSYHHYPVTQDVNLVTWKGTTPNNLISGTVDAFSHYANPTQAYLTGTVDVNVTQWRGTQPNILVSGTIDGFAHYSNVLSSNVTQWNGISPNSLISGTVDAFAHYGNFSTLATTVGQQKILDRIDYQRGHHTVTGNTFYVDGVSGNDATGDGSRSAPYQTISKALTVCVANNHDEIILLPNSAGGPTTITESATIVVSKAYTQIRGPGRDVLVTVTAGANKDVFSITAGGIELSGFRIATNGASSNGVTVSNQADFVLLYRLWIESAHQDAVQFNVANRCQVDECVFVASGRDGVRVTSGAGTGTHNIVLHSTIRDSVGSAVNLQGSDASDCRIQFNVIRDNAVGITIASGVVDTVLTDNRFINNTIEISDAGTRTLQQWNYLTSSILGDVMITGTVNANLIQWEGVAPNILISGTVDGFAHYANTVSANVTQWRGIQPNILISGTIDSFEHYGNPIQSYHTGTVDANVIQWANQNVPTPDQIGIPKVNVTNWASGTVSNPSVIGVPKVDLVDINGLATNGYNATLQLKQLAIKNDDPNNTAVYLVGAGSNSTAVLMAGDVAGLEIDSGGDNSSSILLLPGINGKSIDASYGPIIGDIIGNITGSITGNIYGDVHGYVGWVTGSVQNVLVSTPAAPPTGTINANVIQWIGETPNLLISGTVDAFTHYTNYPSSTITGSVDANVIAWRGDVPNLLISGTVDAYVHYIDKTGYALTSAYDPAKTASQVGDAMTLTAPYDAAKTASQAGDAMTLTAGERINIADAFLKRDWTAVTGEASRSVLNALRFVRNKFSTTAHANKVTIYKEDDTTEAYQKDVTTDATADPIVEG